MAGAMGRCTSCGFEPSYPTTSCPQCAGVVSARAPVASMPAPEVPHTPEGDPNTPEGMPSADRTMRRADLAGPAPEDRTMRRPDLAGAPPPPPTGVPTACPPAPGVAGGPVSALPGAPVSLGSRLLAALVDLLLAWLPVVVLTAVALVLAPKPGTILWIAFNVVTLVVLLLGAALVVVPLGRTGSTVGKALLGVRVVDVRTGGTIGVGRAFLRQLVWGLLGAPCYLGYLTYFTDRSGRQRALHEQAASSVTTAVPRQGFGAALGQAFGAFRR